MVPPPSIGLIIPSANRLTEPQFNTYLPAGVGAYVTRLRMAGKYRKPLAELKPQLIEAAEALSDIKPSVIVFHCTANSMESGLAHEKAIVDIIEQASGSDPGVRPRRHQETRADQPLCAGHQSARSELSE